MCRAALSLVVCETCQNVDLCMISSEFCPRALSNPGDVCNAIELRHNQAVSKMDQLPGGECRVCKVAKNGRSGHPPGANRPVRGSPVEPMIEYFVLMRNPATNQGFSGAGPSRRNFGGQQHHSGQGHSSAGRRPVYHASDDDDDDDYPPGTQFVPAEGGNPFQSHDANSRANTYGRGEFESPYGRYHGDCSPGPMGRNAGPQQSGPAGGYSSYHQGPGGPSPFGPSSRGAGYPRDTGRDDRYSRGSGYPPDSGYQGGSGGPWGHGRR